MSLMSDEELQKRSALNKGHKAEAVEWSAKLMELSAALARRSALTNALAPLGLVLELTNQYKKNIETPTMDAELERRGHRTK
ncbi:protein of unknown function [Magnetospira sp. QH-2]|nr:protein of unknown function [Magnetospira sp. QH-2]